MDTGQFVTGQVKTEVDHIDFNEAFQTYSVKHEPCKINIFSKCGMYDENSSAADFVDVKNFTSCQEQTEEKFYANKPDPEYMDNFEACQDISTDECKTEQIKNENNLDIFYEDIKCEIGEEISSELSKFCEVCNKSFSRETEFIDSKNIVLECSCQKKNDSIDLQGEEMTQDVKPPPLFLNTDFALQLLEVQDKTMSEFECSNKQVSPSAPRRDSVSPLENDENLTSTDIPHDFLLPKSECSSASDENDLFENHEMTDEAGKTKAHRRNHTAERRFYCKMCPKSFTTSSYLNVHFRIHTGEKPYICKICSKSFSTNFYLNVHFRIHTGEKPFYCKICSKSFISKGLLNSHLMVHDTAKRYHCKICSKSFYSNSRLKKHAKIHTGENPFYGEISNSSLNGHLKIHAEEKPFYCEICSKSFAGQNYLNSHLKIHTLYEKIFCKFCSKSFVSDSEMKDHLNIHAGEKLYSCKICSQSFNHLKEFIVHERTHI